MRRGATTLLWPSLLLALSAEAAVDDVNARLAKRIEAVHSRYQAARQAIVRQMNQMFGIDYEALRRLYEEPDRMHRQQLAIVEKITDGTIRRREQEKLPFIFTTPEYLRYAEARLVLENELERNHLLRARNLQAYEQILDELVDSDSLLSYFFRSLDYRSRHGLLLKRVTWELAVGESASTKPLNTAAVFADQARIPFLIKVSPMAFNSVAFLRSILVHELNHVLLFKEPLAAELEARLSSAGMRQSTTPRPGPGVYGLFFSLRHGSTLGYQHHLLHECYSFKAQLLYDEAAPSDPYHRLTPDDRGHIERLYEWALNELNDYNRAFVNEHPDPPLSRYLRQFHP
ncbi:MAG: hypothetical protein HYY90_00835 [Candidatus Omnitrophica bacterium]|nr:hypothetical protein [Candidatus Omnitrophota bacterium]